MRKKIITLLIGLLMLITFTAVTTGDSVEDRQDEIDASVNNAPYAPVVLTEKCGWVEDTYQLTFASIDPDGNAVYYQVNWGKKESGNNIYSCEPDEPQEAWLGPYKSGAEVSLKHEWCEKGKYTITIKAKDSNDLESPETTLSVGKPRIKELHDSVFYQILERLANIFPILREIIKL